MHKTRTRKRPLAKRRTSNLLVLLVNHHGKALMVVADEEQAGSCNTEYATIVLDCHQWAFIR